MVDVAVELLVRGLAQNGLLIGLGEPAEEVDVAGRPADTLDRFVAETSFAGVGEGLRNLLTVAKIFGAQQPRSNRIFSWVAASSS
jgi:hypothetical protein